MTPPPRCHLQRLAVFLMPILGAGCTDYDKSTNPTFVPPTVVSEAPPTGAGGVCPTAVTGHLQPGDESFHHGDHNLHLDNRYSSCGS